MTTNNGDGWEDDSTNSEPKAEGDMSRKHPKTKPVRFEQPAAATTAAPRGSPVKGINIPQILIAAILSAVVAVMFVIKWAPSKADFNTLRTDTQAAMDSMASRNATIDNLVASAGELRIKVDSLINNNYLSEDALDDAIDGLVTEDELGAFMASVLAQIGTTIPQDTLLGLTTEYERDKMMFNVSVATVNTTAYFTIEGTVYYDSTPPATPTPTPMLDGFELIYATEGMSMFAMTTYGKTDTGGVKGYDFTAPVGTWYYDFWITPLSIGGNTTSGSTW